LTICLDSGDKKDHLFQAQSQPRRSCALFRLRGLLSPDLISDRSKEPANNMRSVRGACKFPIFRQETARHQPSLRREGAPWEFAM